MGHYRNVAEDFMSPGFGQVAEKAGAIDVGDCAADHYRSYLQLSYPRWQDTSRWDGKDERGTVP
ncbi:MAG: hypothetical protein U9Q37_05770 [Euryarchaeota archaeon]|nr:hypothetical protein [Euryarchaeota archaeon]